jgi:signal transduction histidine kinase/CheY-like chemotaxis protein
VIAWRALHSREVAESVADLRRDSLQFFIICTAAGYLGWHFVSAAVLAGQTDDVAWLLDHWSLLPIVLAGLGLSQLLLHLRSPLAVPCFLVTSLVSVTGAVWLLDSSSAALLYPLLVLVAVVMLDPLAGLLVGGCAVGLLSLLVHGPLGDAIGPEVVTEVGAGSLLVVVAAWALGRNMVTAVEWSTASSAQAVRNAEEARQSRAELAAALRQLDYANYRLQRANSALELAWAAAEAAERAKSELVTNISHELRTPLNLVAGFSEMILTSPESYREPLPASYRGDLNAIYRSAQHLLTLTNDVIDLARVGMGRLAVVREPIDVQVLVEDACEIVRAYVQAKGLWLRVEVPPGLPPILLDRLRIRQVLLNLLTNAARFTERGGITVTVTLDEDVLRVEVHDTGRGIAPDDLSRVFTEFHHDGGALASASEGLGGVGLGLPISKRMVELHGGSMDVASEPGAGTTFWFTVPGTADPAEQVAHAGIDTRRRPDRDHEGERLVVLASAGGQLGRFVERHLTGARVMVSPDLRLAWQAAVEHRALAVMTDGTAGEIGALDDLPVPLIRLPAPDSRLLADRYGVLGMLVKPVSRADLTAAVGRVPGPVGSVLIADDDPRFGRLVARMLAASPLGPDVEIRSAHNGREALDLLRERRPDLLLLDLAMPELGGEEVVAAMRAEPALATVPVIIMSAQDEIAGRFPLHGELAVGRPDGFRLEEALAAVEAVLGVLEPPRRYLTEPAVSSGTAR